METPFAETLTNLANQMTRPLSEIVEKLRVNSPRTPETAAKERP